jgi:hypothetical protein
LAKKLFFAIIVYIPLCRRSQYPAGRGKPALCLLSGEIKKAHGKSI